MCLLSLPPLRNCCHCPAVRLLILPRCAFRLQAAHPRITFLTKNIGEHCAGDTCQCFSRPGLRSASVPCSSAPRSHASKALAQPTLGAGRACCCSSSRGPCHQGGISRNVSDASSSTVSAPRCSRASGSGRCLPAARCISFLALPEWCPAGMALDETPNTVSYTHLTLPTMRTV